MDLVHTLRWPVALVVVAVLGYFIAARAMRAVEVQQAAPGAAVDRVEELASGIAGRFRTGEITTTFVAALPRLVPDGGSRLEVAVLEATETFERTDEQRVLFDLVPLGTNVAQIRVPATYRYHLRLDDPWRVEVRDQACIVYAPSLRPTLPTAFDTDRMERRSSRGWARLGADEQLEELQRSVTPTLNERAAAPETVNLVREQARERVAEFVRNWLLAEEHWRSDRFRSVTVIFADDEEGGADAGESPRRPTVVLGEENE